MLSAGAQQGMIVVTAPFQPGVLKFAKAHGVPMVTVTEGQLNFGDSIGNASMGRQKATERLVLSTFVGWAYRQASEGKGTGVTLLDSEHPEHIVEVLRDVFARI